MATTIEWVQNPDGSKGETWNPIVGCSKISAGCTHCYAEVMAKRLKEMRMAQYQAVVNERGWTGKLEFVQSALQKPLKRKTPTTYFVNSMSDIFHKQVPFEWVKLIFDVIAQTPQHTYQILTKRDIGLFEVAPHLTWHPNIWMGVSVENQLATTRIDYLRQVPARVRFLSCEPLLEEVNLNLEGIHWVIAGGESGNGYRAVKPEWVRSIRDQCQEQNVPFFFKQWGGRTPKVGGRELDGRFWDEWPLSSLVV